MANAKRKPAHRSMTHHKVAHRRKSTLSRLGKVAGFLALPIPDVELAVAAMANPDSGIKFVLGIVKKAGRRASEVQSVLFDRVKWTAMAAKQWLEDHGFTAAGKDEGATFWRFRQQSPSKYKEFRTIVPGARRNPEMHGRYEHPAPMRDWRSEVSVGDRIYRTRKEAEAAWYDSMPGRNDRAKYVKVRGGYKIVPEGPLGGRGHYGTTVDDMERGETGFEENPEGEGSHYAVVDGVRVGLGTDNIIIFSTDWEHLWKLAAKGDHRLVKRSGGPETMGHTDLFYVGHDVKEYPSYEEKNPLVDSGKDHRNFVVQVWVRPRPDFDGKQRPDYYYETFRSAGGHRLAEAEIAKTGFHVIGKGETTDNFGALVEKWTIAKAVENPVTGAAGPHSDIAMYAPNEGDVTVYGRDLYVGAWHVIRGASSVEEAKEWIARNRFERPGHKIRWAVAGLESEHGEGAYSPVQIYKRIDGMNRVVVQHAEQPGGGVAVENPTGPGYSGADPEVKAHIETHPGTWFSYLAYPGRTPHKGDFDTIYAAAREAAVSSNRPVFIGTYHRGDEPARMTGHSLAVWPDGHITWGSEVPLNRANPAPAGYLDLGQDPAGYGPTDVKRHMGYAEGNRYAVWFHLAGAQSKYGGSARLTKTLDKAHAVGRELSNGRPGSYMIQDQVNGSVVNFDPETGAEVGRGTYVHGSKQVGWQPKTITVENPGDEFRRARIEKGSIGDRVMTALDAMEAKGEEIGRSWRLEGFKPVTAAKLKGQAKLHYKELGIKIPGHMRGMYQLAYERGFERGLGGEGNPSSYDSQHPDLGQAAFDAGKAFRLTGAYNETGVTNARVAKYGFSKWYNNIPPGPRGARATRGHLKTRLLKNWMEGWAAGKRVEKRGNPESSAADLYKEFHGKEPGETKEIITEVRGHEWLTQLGALVELKVATVTDLDATATFEKDAPDLCSSEDGRQLYIEGGDQALDLAAIKMSGDKWLKDSMVIGVIYELTYSTKKGFHKFRLTDYFHKLGEETGEQPTLLYDPNNRLLSISGGQYQVKDVGIVN